MKHLRLLILILLCAPIAFAKANHPAPTIACFGDSITAGHGAPIGKSYPDYLQKILTQKGYHYRVLNMGISGDTTKDAVNRLPNVLAAHPAIVIVEFGGNDGLRGLPITTTRANYDRIIATLQHAGIKVALAGITLPPNYGADYIHAINQTYVLAAKKFHTPLLPFLYDHVYNVPGAIQPDGIHATAKGNALVAQNIFRLILPLLHK
ncbi:MAG TPA: arylesterase [Acidobacteriaceae bacterium]|nr:arylesterase [Acidobacteriaceae bacterium]